MAATTNIRSRGMGIGPFSGVDRTIESDRLCVRDRGCALFQRLNNIVAAKSSCVCRLHDNSVCEVAEEQPLTEAGSSPAW